jgi:hypothetical protein
MEKFFNYLDMYPSSDEIKDAKMNVLKCKLFFKLFQVAKFINMFESTKKVYKRKANSTSIEKEALFDIIYYIYPPVGSKLKSTRKSAWLNPVVGDEDALKLKGKSLSSF